jgi:cytochrome c-type biogenesis protein CcmF
VSAALAIAAAALGFSLGLRHPAALAVTAAATLAGAVLAGSVVIEIRGNPAIGPWRSLFRTLHSGRRQYAGFFIHLGFVFLAIGVTASSLGSLRTELLISEGETIEWAGHSVHYRKLVQHELPDKLVAEAILEVTRAGGRRCTLRPARHLHLLQNEWTTEVAIESSWSGDFYTILNSGEGNGRVSLTLVKNPLIWCIWLSGAVMAAGAIVALWPGPRRLSAASAYRTRLGPVRRRSAELAVSP